MDLTLLVIIYFASVKADLIQTLIKEAEYPLQIHSMYTPDGFKLRVHRIPKNNKDSVILVHGLLETGVQWVIGDKKKALAFMLADAGYDVWLFNARGTSYSSFHKTLNIHSDEYWDFSWHEIGSIDLKIVVDYIESVTNASQSLHYVGYSQGGTIPFVLLSMYPEYNAKIKSVQLLAPAVFMKGFTSSVRLLIPYEKQIRGIGIFALDGKQLKPLIQQNCQFFSIICTNFLFRFVGDDTGNFDVEKVFSLFTQKVIDRSSFKQVEHYSRNIVSGEYRFFDYGSAQNKKRYGSKVAPDYNLSAVISPVTIYFGSKDALVPEDGIRKLMSRLPNVKESFLLEYNHLDFTFAKNIDTLVHARIIKTLKNSSN